ncbi:MAG: 2-dehydropantoate 2-reductase [Sphingobium sp.]|nr:MAG: 2-dehydropantoate 2-reductase [Sphingobium sp.]
MIAPDSDWNDGVPSPRVGVFGAGAIGTLVAARLALTGHAVTVVARGDRLACIAGDGLRLRDTSGHVVTAQVRAVTAADAGEQDILLIALKAQDIPTALPEIAPLVGAQTTIVPLVNGIPWWYFQPSGTTHVEAVDPGGRLAATFAAERIIGAVLFVTSALATDGVVDVQGVERLILGPVVEGNDGPMAPLLTLFGGCGMDVMSVPDIRRDMWTKVALNLATNPLSVVAHATLREQFHDPALRPLVAAVLEECYAVARGQGIDPRMTVAQMLAVGDRAGDFYTSMAQDHARGAPLELGAIALSVLEIAERAGVAMPVSRMIVDLCRFRAAKRKPE